MSTKSEFLEEIDKDQERAENRIDLKPGKVTLYVENETDIPFWYTIFKRFVPSLKVEFDYASLSITENPEDKSARGKGVLLKRVRENPDFVNQNRLVCVDSDYDFLVPLTEDAKTIISRRPYILQTYTYAIENYKCLANSLDCICVDATHSAEHEFDFVAFLREYSKTIYELFVYSIYSKRKNLEPAIKCRGNVAVGDCVKLEDKGNGMIATVKKRAEEELQKVKESLKITHPGFEVEIRQLKKILEKRYVTPENVYLFMDAHTLFNGVVCPILKKAVCKPKRKRHGEITAKTEEIGADKNTKNGWHDSYNKMIPDPIALLNVNKAHFYHDCLPLKCIERDIRRYLDKHPIGASAGKASATAL